jgi:N-acetylglucosamine-6-phosphate deacetylase
MPSPSTTIIHSARPTTGTGTQSNTWVRFDGRLVTARGTGDGWLPAAHEGAALVDARGRWLAPGFIDLHCHGGGGVSVEDGDGAIQTILAVHGAHGTTRSVLSLVTAPIEVLIARLQAVARTAAVDPRVLGSHLEGPILDDEFRGAHDPSLLRDADAETLDRLMAAAAGTLRQLTIAPERPGATVAITRLVDADVAVAIGHTGADFETASRAFDLGASILTHAFNGMRGIHHRSPGPVVAAIRSEHVTLEIINDGTHVHPAVVGLAFATAPGRIALITDAMAAAGAGDGEYRLGTLDVVVHDGVAELVAGHSIAGSTLTQDQSLRRAVLDCRVPLDQAVMALTTVPAAAIGRAHDLGRLEPGFLADAVLLSDDLHVEAVWASGSRLC